VGASTAGLTGVLSEGVLLGDYEIVGVVGTGGMGVVYRARQRSLGRVVALKVIRDDIASAAEYRERFLREARLAASVDHPNVVPVFDVGEYDGRLVLAMQWVDGQDLRTVLAQSGRLEPNRAIELVCQLASALEAVHSAAGLVHRDVKPGNVLLRNVGGSEHAYLTDFGVARPGGSDGQFTQTGGVVGTTGYLSPEQIRGAEPDSRSDLYALGCLFFEAVTGRPPFTGDNEMALRWAHANDPRPVPSAVLPELGVRYDQFTSRALAINPQQRFGSARELSDALRAAHGGELGQSAAAVVAPTHEPTAVGPSVPLTPAVLQTPPPQPAFYQTPGYATPPPPATPPARGGSPLALVLLAVVALAGITAGALIAAGVFSHGTAAAVAGPVNRARANTAARVTHRNAPAATTASKPTSPPVSSTQTTTTPPTSPSRPSLLPGSPVTGQDASGYNTGQGCSDDPQTSLPGCADSPSAPNGDDVSSCSAAGVTAEVYAPTTSCQLAAAVIATYSTDGPVTVTGPNGATHTFICQTGGQGTTGNTICISGGGLTERYVRW
jgi:serine/threonine protein kinase